MHFNRSSQPFAPFTRCLALLLIACAVSLEAAEPELITDRPDQTESTAIVGRGVVQIETGALLERDESDTLVEESTELAGTLVRWGLSERFELRFGFAGFLKQDTETPFGRSHDEGLGDAELGFKLRLREGDGKSPALALIAATSLPVGEDGFTSDRFDPIVRLSVSHDLASGAGFGWNLGYRRESTPTFFDTEHQDFFFYTASLALPVGDRWGTFFELFGDIATGGDGEDAHSFDTGITFLLTDDVQLDTFAGGGITDEAPDTFLGVGISWRLR